MRVRQGILDGLPVLGLALGDYTLFPLWVWIYCICWWFVQARAPPGFPRGRYPRLRGLRAPLRLCRSQGARRGSAPGPGAAPSVLPLSPSLLLLLLLRSPPLSSSSSLLLLLLSPPPPPLSSSSSSSSSPSSPCPFSRCADSFSFGCAQDCLKVAFFAITRHYKLFTPFVVRPRACVRARVCVCVRVAAHVRSRNRASRRRACTTLLSPRTGPAAVSAHGAAPEETAKTLTPPGRAPRRRWTASRSSRPWPPSRTPPPCPTSRPPPATTEGRRAARPATTLPCSGRGGRPAPPPCRVDAAGRVGFRPPPSSPSVQRRGGVDGRVGCGPVHAVLYPPAPPHSPFPLPPTRTPAHPLFPPARPGRGSPFWFHSHPRPRLP